MAVVAYSLFRQEVLDDTEALVKVADDLEIEDTPNGTPLTKDGIVEAVVRTYYDTLDNPPTEPDDVARRKRAGVFVAVKPDRLLWTRAQAERTYTFSPVQ